jgi:hypothetical protein
MIRAYLSNVGEGLDHFLNALLFFGSYKETISKHSAREQDKKAWACVMCGWLGLTVEKDHCTKTLADETMSPRAGLLALIQLMALGTVVFAAYYWGLFALLKSWGVL